MGLERLGAQSPVQMLVVSRVDGGFANKWHIAMYEDAKVVCSVLEVGPRHCRYVRCPKVRTGGVAGTRCGSHLSSDAGRC